MTVRRWIYRSLGVAALSTGTVGLVLPLLPTTPFVLLALWAAARSDPALGERIRTHPRFKATVSAWERHRAVPRPAKVLALLMLAASWSLLWWIGSPVPLRVGLGALFLVVGGWLATRPVPPHPGAAP